MNDELREKHLRLVGIINTIGKACIAYSGGVDSALLLKVFRDTLDEKRVLAITAVSDTYSKSEKIMAEKLAQFIGVKHITLQTTETDDPDFIDNNAKRCYYCKKSFYKELLQIAHVHGFAIICDGSNIDDLNDYRMGKKAAEEFGVRSPLIEAGIGKEDVRAISRELGLPEWDRPANPCLASRIPYGNKITLEKLSTVEQSEEFIKSLGFSTVRVRHHGEIARIEVPQGDIERIMDVPIRKTIAENLKKFGFNWISVDIEGYRMGSMNEVLNLEKNMSSS